jgi:hypothetical protein
MLCAMRCKSSRHNLHGRAIQLDNASDGVHLIGIIIIIIVILYKSISVAQTLHDIAHLFWDTCGPDFYSNFSPRLILNEICQK